MSDWLSSRHSKLWYGRAAAAVSVPVRHNRDAVVHEHLWPFLIVICDEVSECFRYQVFPPKRRQSGAQARVHAAA